MNSHTKNIDGISILLATKDRPEMTMRCVSSLLENSDNSLMFEIIILDQSNTPISMTIDSNNVRYIHLKETGKCIALNHGVVLSRYLYIAIIDDDCIAGADWILKIYQAIKNLEHKCIITGRVIAGEIESGAEISILHDDINEKRQYKKDFITPIFKLSGCNFGFNKSDINIIGDFDTDFGPGAQFKSSDDNEWCYRALHNHGYSLIYDPEIIVIHRSYRSSNEQAKQFSDYGYASGAFFCYVLKHSTFDFFYHISRLFYWSLQTFLIFNHKKIIWQSLYLREFLHGFIHYAKK